MLQIFLVVIKLIFYMQNPMYIHIWKIESYWRKAHIT